MIDHVDIGRSFDWVELQAELLLNCCEEARQWIWRVGAGVVRVPCQDEVVPAGEAGLIHYWPIEKALHAKSKVGHGVVGESSAAAARAT